MHIYVLLKNHIGGHNSLWEFTHVASLRQMVKSAEDSFVVYNFMKTGWCVFKTFAVKQKLCFVQSYFVLRYDYLNLL